jgi:ankyrin repeat protein
MHTIAPFSLPAHPQQNPPDQTALQQQLNNAIVYSAEHEIGMMVDRALSAGARLNLRVEYATHPLALAVRANQPWAIAVLMARGATLPDVPLDGTDLLMEACKAGHAEMARSLLSVAGMEIEGKNALGMMPLHFAIISGVPGAVKVLLEADANPDAIVKSGGLDEYLPTFQEEQNLLPDDRVTPLMLAAALGDDNIVQQLLRAGADPNVGTRLPLVIAARKGHTAVVKTFLDAGCDPNECYDESEHKGLQALIFPDTNIESLRLLLPRIRLKNAYVGRYSPLRDALTQDLLQVLALLLASHEDSDDLPGKLADCWTVADSLEDTPGEFLDLMTTAIARSNLVAEGEAFPELLDQIREHCNDDAKIACSGIFPSLLAPVREKLRKVKKDNSLSIAQGRLRAAFIITHLPPNIPGPALSSGEPLPPDMAWKEKTERARYEQSQQLRIAVNTVIERAVTRLRSTVDLDFFLNYRKEAASDMDMLWRIMDSDLIDDTGASTNLVQIIRDAWIQAAQWRTNWDVAPASEEDADHFLLHISHNLLRLQLEDFHSELEIDKHYADVLKKSLSEISIPLKHFCADPVTWLRTLEHRSHLRPVDSAALAIKLQIELGLPMHTARSIADAWHLAIEATRNGRTWRTTAQLHQELEKSLAGTIGEVMSSEQAQDVVPKSDRELITAWCATKRGATHTSPAPSTESLSTVRSPDDIRGRKRPVTDEPVNSPASKKHRPDNSVDESSD